MKKNRKINHIRHANKILELRYLMEQATPPATPPTTGSTPTERKEVIPTIKTSTGMSLKKDGMVIKWENQTEDQKTIVAKKCDWDSVDEYEKNEFKCSTKKVGK